MLDDVIVYLDRAGRRAGRAQRRQRRARRRAAAGGGAVRDRRSTDRHRELAVLAVQGPRSARARARRPGLHGVRRPGRHAASAAPATPASTATSCSCRGTRRARCGTGCVAAGARPCGLGARDTLRTEMGYPLHGQDLTPEITPGAGGQRLGGRLGQAGVLGPRRAGGREGGRARAAAARAAGDRPGGAAAGDGRAGRRRARRRHDVGHVLADAEGRASRWRCSTRTWRRTPR